MLVTSGISGIGKPLRFAKRPSKESGPTIFAYSSFVFINDSLGTLNSTYTAPSLACLPKASILAG